MSDGMSRYEDDEVVIVQSVKTTCYPVEGHTRLMIINQLVTEAMADVPEPDLIEVRVIRYDAVPRQEEPDERSAQQPPDPEPPAV